MADKEYVRVAYVIYDDGESAPMVLGRITGQYDDDSVMTNDLNVLRKTFESNPHVRITEVSDDIPF